MTDESQPSLEGTRWEEVEEYIRHEVSLSSKFLADSDSKHITKHIQSQLFKYNPTDTPAKMRFSLTTIAIALLGTAMALPNPSVNPLEERATVSTCF